MSSANLVSSVPHISSFLSPLLFDSAPRSNAMVKRPHSPCLFVWLTCLSLLLSATAVVLGALVLRLTPALWIIPGAFTLTIAYHSFIFLYARTHETESTGWFSLFTVGGAYALTIVWIAALTITIIFTTLISIGKLDDIPGSDKGSHQRLERINPVLISVCALSLVESGVLSALAIISHKERRRALYQAKWQWTVSLNSHSKWSITKESL